MTLRAARRPAEGALRGVALVLHGRTEFLEKYAGTSEDLAARGFEVWSTDWRGQGGSHRPLADARKGHVGHFAEYQRDVAALAAASAGTAGPRLVLAHSMGGAIALRALGERTVAASAAIFSAPMWGLTLPPLQRLTARFICRAAVALGLGEAYVPGGGGPEPYAFKGFEGNALTGDREAFDRIVAQVRGAGARALGGPTFGWLHAAFLEMAALERVRTPCPALVLVGEEECVVDPGAIRARAARDGLRHALIPHARHELFYETPARRAAVWAEIDAFLEAAFPRPRVARGEPDAAQGSAS